MRLIIPQQFSKRIRRHLAKKTEQVVFLFLDQRDPDSFECKNISLIPESELVNESEFHAEVSERAIAAVIKEAATSNSSLCEVHSHPFNKTGTEFSPSDKSGFSEFVPHVWWRLRSKPYFAIVSGQRDCDALAWVKDPVHPTAISEVHFGRKILKPTGISYKKLMDDITARERYVRQEFFFGKGGQRKLQQQKVVVVGVGGVGSHVVQQLAYLGVDDFVVIDNDFVDGTNLNRLIGATAKDLGMRKTLVASRLVTTIQPHARIHSVDVGLLSKAGIDALKTADFVFGCLDEDGVRSVLLEACCTFKRPYIDLATDVPDEKTFGGRLVFTGLGKGCLHCREQLSQEEIDWYFSSPEQRKEIELIYGIRKAALGDTGPSVVFLNGVLASLGVQEFAIYVNPVLRNPLPFLEYRGNMGLVFRPKDEPKPTCYFCSTIWNAKVSQDIYRYAKDEK